MVTDALFDKLFEFVLYPKRIDRESAECTMDLNDRNDLLAGLLDIHKARFAHSLLSEFETARRQERGL